MALADRQEYSAVIRCDSWCSAQPSVISSAERPQQSSSLASVVRHAPVMRTGAHDVFVLVFLPNITFAPCKHRSKKETVGHSVKRFLGFLIGWLQMEIGSMENA